MKLQEKIIYTERKLYATDNIIKKLYYKQTYGVFNK